MTTQLPPAPRAGGARSAARNHPVLAAASKVPLVTAFFWIIKVCGTTVGETAADFLNETLGLGLGNTSIVVAIALAGVLAFQFRARRYVPALYWGVVVLVSIAGTLATDNLVDGHGVSLVATTIGFGLALVAAFLGWYRSEHDLSIHNIRTPRREAWYWLTVLCTFALGTSAGDLISERIALGYGRSLLLFAALIGVVVVVHRTTKLAEVSAFWAVYILTRPLGASLGDLLLQSRADGGLGYSTGLVTAGLLAIIVGLVGYLTWSRVDQPIEVDLPSRAVGNGAGW